MDLLGIKHCSCFPKKWYLFLATNLYSAFLIIKGTGWNSWDKNLLIPPFLYSIESTASDWVKNFPSVYNTIVWKSDFISFFFKKLMAKLDCRLAKVKSPLGSFLMTYLTQKLHRLQTPSKKIIFDPSFTSLTKLILMYRQENLI